MYKLIVLILLANFFCLLCGCSKPEWIETNEGVYFYSKTKSNNSYSWEGEVIANILHGEGQLTTYKKGKVLDKKNIKANYGIIDTENEYIHTENGDFLGNVDKNMLPKEFGVLIDKNTLQVGIFKKGEIYEGNVHIYQKKGDKYVPYYIGDLKKKRFDNIGDLYESGALVYSGFWKKGSKHGFGKEYMNNYMIYDGEFSNNQRDGMGKEYCNNILIYNGEWKDGKRDGYGTLYSDNGIVKYKGEWKDGLYHGDGKLYEKGKCIDGKWKEGRNVETFSVSLIEQIQRTKELLIGKEDDADDNNENVMIDIEEEEFIINLYSDIRMHLTQEFEKRVSKRFNLINIPRMVLQSVFKDGIKRSDYAQDFFVKNVSSDDIQDLINSKIEYYNSQSSDMNYNYVQLNNIPKNAIVDSEVSAIIFDRESMEGADIIIDLLITILVCCIISFIIEFILVFFIPFLLGYCAIIDTVLIVVAFVLTIIISIKTTGQMSTELENMIIPMLVDNYINFIESQDFIIQMFGLL